MENAPQLRIPNVIPINDHIWLLDDNHQATCYVVAGSKQAAVIDTSLGMSNIRAVAEALTSLPLICVNTHGHGDHMGGNWAFDKAYMHPADLPLAEKTINRPELQNAIRMYPGVPNELPATASTCSLIRASTKTFSSGTGDCGKK